MTHRADENWLKNKTLKEEGQSWKEKSQINCRIKISQHILLAIDIKEKLTTIAVFHFDKLKAGSSWKSRSRFVLNWSSQWTIQRIKKTDLTIKDKELQRNCLSGTNSNNVIFKRSIPTWRNEKKWHFCSYAKLR
jgi:hypothetical protein